MKRKRLKQKLSVLVAFFILFSVSYSNLLTPCAQESEDVNWQEESTEDVYELHQIATDGDATISAEQSLDESLLTVAASYDDAKAYEVLAMVNQERANQGLNALTMDADLFSAAKVRAAEIQVSFSHTRPDGTSCFTVSDKACGENIAAGYRSVSNVMNAWMNSTGHRENILRRYYKSIGISCYNYNGTLYWVQLFGIDDASSESTMSAPETIYNGVDYSGVYDYDYYISTYGDIKAAYGSDSKAALQHFVLFGMREGRQGNSEFNVTYYKNRYVDLRSAFGNDLVAYYTHYIYCGKNEGRDAHTECGLTGYVTCLNGVDYSAVYNYEYYLDKYTDLKQAYTGDDIAALQHFVYFGMREGRQGCVEFNVGYYRNRYADLRTAYKKDIKSYYMHYIYFGKREGRDAKTACELTNYVTSLDGIDYGDVYDYTYYLNQYDDLKKAFDGDEVAALRHFVLFGMREGRQASEAFNVTAYKNRYVDLKNAFGADLQNYYFHYIAYGKNEGRKGN